MILYALFCRGQQISKAHTMPEAVLAEAYERGAVVKRSEDFPGDPPTHAALAPGYTIRPIGGSIDRLPAAPILLCLDFEASGTGPRSYPIEVAIAVVATGVTREWLIAPTPAWLETGEWEAEAEAVHGIARAEIIAHGRAVNDVAAELTAWTRGAQVLSDAPTYDTKWLRDLYRAVGAEPPFLLLDFHQIVWREAAVRRRPDIAIVKAEAEAYMLFPKQHRAGPDARRNAEMLRRVQGR